MQDRYDRNRGQERQSGSDWLNDDDTSWEGRDRDRDEGRSWAGGAEREPGRGDGYGRSSDQGRGGYGRPATPYDRYDSQSRDMGRSYGGREDGGARYGQSSRSGEFGQGYGYGRAFGQGSSQEYGRGRDSYDIDTSREYRGSRYSRDDGADGARTWQGGRDGVSAGRSDYEPDYLHWREQQMSKFDKDYDDWRAEKRQKFSSDFDTWRTGRNALVENVSDGGTGSQKDVKNS